MFNSEKVGRLWDVVETVYFKLINIYQSSPLHQSVKLRSEHKGKINFKIHNCNCDVADAWSKRAVQSTNLKITLEVTRQIRSVVWCLVNVFTYCHCSNPFLTSFFCGDTR